MRTSHTISQLRQFCGPKADEIMRITGLSDYELSETIQNEGWAFIRRLQRSGQGWGDELNCARAFWNWWRMTWYSDDHTFAARYCNDTLDRDSYVYFHRIEIENRHFDRATLEMILNRSAK